MERKEGKGDLLSSRHCYQADALQASRDALGLISDVAPMDLERFEEAHPELLPKLYPYDPMHLLVRRELDDLFDTAPDLSGADVDISRFIRSGDERDVHVFWADVPAGSEPSPEIRAMRDGLCAVQFIKAREWLCGTGKGDALKENGAHKRTWAWVWDWLDGRWRRCTRRDCWPGQTILVAAQCGGYLKEFGWSPDATVSVDSVNAEPTADSRADDAQDDEALSAFAWRTIATHGGDVASEALKIGSTLTPALAAILHLAGRWHDVGKAHPAFQNSISDVSSDGRQKLKEPTRQDLAKAPKKAWLNVRKLYPMDGGRRPGFRHELASTLALFAVLRRHRCDHPALLGPWCELLEKAGRPALMEVPTATAPNPLEQEILALSAEDFDLLAFLVCSHHGKVRVSWHACPADQVSGDRSLRIRGIRDQDTLPAVPLIDAQGGIHDLPKTVLDLAPAAAGLDRRFGRGWTERVLGLLAQHGPFRLAWLESCLRAADIRGSRITVVDSRVEIIS